MPAHPLSLRLCVLLAALLPLVPQAGFAQDQRRPADNGQPPSIRFVAPQARLPVQLSSLTSNTEIVGRAARTRIEITLENPNERVLEGQIEFPLQPGQQVTGFALDIDGEMRPAVAVPKAKGRQTFDDVTRARVDPALLESTGANNYKLRVYPLPARGTRRVVLDIEELLPATAGKARLFELPMRFGSAVKSLQVNLRVAGATPAQVDARVGAQTLTAVADGPRTARVSFTRTSWTGAAPLRVVVPESADRDVVSTGVYRDETYFLADVPFATRSQPRPLPSKIALLWDASGSGATRDHARELALLDAWFRAVPNVRVDLQLVRDTTDAPRPFEVRNGDWRALRQALESVAYDGATALAAATAPPDAQEVLLFSDGQDNWSAAQARPFAVPMHTIAAGAGVDATRLRQWAQASAGTYVDLASGNVAQSVLAMRTVHSRVTALRSTSATELVADGMYADSGRLLVAGKLSAPRATLEIETEGPDGKRGIRKVEVTAVRDNAARPSLAPGRWAALTLARLEADADRNSAAIQRLGMQFGIATRETSLIVLDSVADYARYEIEPPPSLRAEYSRLRANAMIDLATKQAQHRSQVVQRFEAQANWWNKDFPKDSPPPPPVLKDAAARGQIVGLGAAAPAAAPAPAPAMAAPAPGAANAAREMSGMASEASSRQRQQKADGQSQPDAVATIQLRKWQPDSPYARRLRAAPAEGMYAIYMDERPAYVSSTAFFIDAADIFIERGQRELGLRILSNLAEMELENRHILRILGYRLMQANAVKLAIPVLRKVQKLAPDEPQSWRDLAHALAADGQPQEAVNLLWHVADSIWAQRFPDVELIALEEMNALIARSKSDSAVPLDVSAIEPRLLKNMPLDLRVVLTWDADNTDIDLHVIDPNGEEVFFGRALSYQGGRISKDFTGGYGPEEFTLKRAKPGTYTVKARFYGHRQQIVAPATTLMLWLSTGFGTPAQKDQSTVLRLSGAGDMVTVGTFTVEAQ